MRRVILLGAILFINVHAKCQQSYVVSRGYESYDTLTNYTSILDILMSPVIYATEIKVDFGFSFPFFGAQYDSVTLDGDGVAIFPQAVNYNFYVFTGEAYENLLLANRGMQSDWRFKKDTANGLRILKVEWRNVGLEQDVTSAHPSNEFLNFQAWFYENGIFEVHFGDINLANSPYYSDSLGAIIDTNGIFGPYMGIENNDESKVYFVTGNNSNFSVITVDSLINIFHSIPPPGEFYRFAPLGTGINEPQNKQANDFNVYPNPVHQSATVAYDLGQSCMVSIIVYDGLGRAVSEIPASVQAQGRHQVEVEFNHISKGAYVIELKLSDNVLHKQIILN
jgi:hypothetical protein